MTIERASMRLLPKPWGVVDLRPWIDADQGRNAIGEIWYDRSAKDEATPALLLKLLFTSQPLSIQVHPNDDFAQSAGQPNGKTEAWYVLKAAPDAKIALGLKQTLTPQKLRQAIDDGSITDLVAWKAVTAGDSILVPAGTIHAIGAGLVIAEIQQRSDTTYRIFDFGRERELHIDDALAVAVAGPAGAQVRHAQISDERTVLVSSRYFVIERIKLAPNSAWHFEGECETWLLALSGDARAGPFEMSPGHAIFVQGDSTTIHAGPDGLVGLVTYAGSSPAPRLLQRIRQDDAIDRGPPHTTPAFTLREQKTRFPSGGPEVIK